MYTHELNSQTTFKETRHIVEVYVAAFPSKESGVMDKLEKSGLVVEFECNEDCACITMTGCYSILADTIETIKQACVVLTVKDRRLGDMDA